MRCVVFKFLAKDACAVRFPVAVCVYSPFKTVGETRETIVGKLLSLQHLNVLGGLADAETCIEAHLGFIVLTFLRGDNDNSVCSCRTINGRGRGVFKHLHRLDVGWVDPRERVECGTTRYGRGRHFAVVHVDKCAIYHIKRLCSGVDGVVSADNHVDISTQFARRSRYVYACDLTRHRVKQRCRIRFA